MRSAQTRKIGRFHPLTRVLAAQGYSGRDACWLINLVFDQIKAALKRHDTVTVPIGTFAVVAQPVTSYRRWWRGRPVEFYGQRYHVQFTPSKEVQE